VLYYYLSKDIENHLGAYEAQFMQFIFAMFLVAVKITFEVKKNSFLLSSVLAVAVSTYILFICVLV
jgi:hypothetical protein